MNTIQINKIMKSDKFTKKIYRGTFAKDQLPLFKNIQLVLFLIMNQVINKVSIGLHYLLIKKSMQNFLIHLEIVQNFTI